MPIIEQFKQMKEKHPDCLLLFRCGDNYEAFGRDAIICNTVLNEPLKKVDGYANVKFVHYALDTYLPKLIRAGHRIAICDQLDPPPVPQKAVEKITPSDKL